MVIMTARNRQTTIAHFSLALAALLMLALSACATHRYEPGKAVVNEKLRLSLEEKLGQTYPPQFKMSQKLALLIGRKQYDFIGYLIFKKPGDFRALAMGEMGGKVFDFLASGGGHKILKKPPLMPVRPLEDGVMGGIHHLFGLYNMDAAYLIARPGKQLGLVVPAGRGRLMEYVFQARAHELTSSQEIENGRVVREAFYSGYRKLKGWSRPIPTHIELHDYKWHYDIKVDVLELTPLPPQDGLLKAS